MARKPDVAQNAQVTTDISYRAVFEYYIGVEAAGKSLEAISKPLQSMDDKAA